jgi:hypothetical protein
MSSSRPDRPEDHRRKWDRNEYERLAQDRITKKDVKEEGNFFLFC